jgi:hypothetical protein
MARSLVAVALAGGYTAAMRKALRLIASLVFFVPAFALLGAFAAMDESERTPWLGIGAGGFVGLFVGIALGGYRAKWFASLFVSVSPCQFSGHGRF